MRLDGSDLAAMKLQGTTTSTDTEGKVKPSDKNAKYSEHTTSTESANYDDFMNYVIEAGDRMYTGKQRLNFPWSKTANVTIGEKVKFAVQRDKMYLVDSDGKEFSMRIVKTALKSAQ